MNEQEQMIERLSIEKYQAWQECQTLRQLILGLMLQTGDSSVVLEHKYLEDAHNYIIETRSDEKGIDLTLKEKRE